MNVAPFIRAILAIALVSIMASADALAAGSSSCPCPAGKPYFSAYLSGNQTITSNTATKVQFNTVNFDSGSYYDNVTNFRYTPLVAGKYRFLVHCQASASTGNAGSPEQCMIYKNGSPVNVTNFTLPNGNPHTFGLEVTAIISMNGTTDFIEGWATNQGTGSVVVSGGATLSWIEGTFIGP